MTLPTVFTLIRLGMVPAIILFFYLPFDWARPLCAACFLIGGLTDTLDGYLARKLKQHSEFGAFLDPVADKILVMVTLVLLTTEAQQIWFTLCTCLILCRELLMSALREWTTRIGQASSTQVNIWGKLKTSCQMLSLLLLLYPVTLFGSISTYQIGSVLLVLATALACYSIFVYIKVALQTRHT